MKLPISWLKKYIDIKISAEKLAEILTMSGTSVEHIEKKNGEAVLDIEVTTNRPDCLSILGLAREVSALTGKKINFPKILPLPSAKTGLFNLPKPTIVVEDKKGCPKYTARVISGISIRSAPIEIQKNLGQIGARTINNVVDATNFVLLEIGQPLHAFDYDKIKGGTVVVRRAKSGEKFLGLDGVEYTLDPTILVIADSEKPVAIAGVMGGQLTEVGPSTKNILLESAFFDPASVRQTSRKLKLTTESSYRFERTVDIENVESASARARDLIVEWAGGREVGSLVDVSSRKKEKPKTIALPTSRVAGILGTKIPKNRIAAILKSLGFGLKAVKNETFFVTIPSSRRDVTCLADLVEEILRIEGFEKIPVSIPETRHAENPIRDKKAEKILELKKFLAAIGLQEIITYSLLSEKALRNSGFEDLSRAQKIKNPASAEQEFLRPTLLAGMLSTILFNVHRKAQSLKFFEIGNRYRDSREETVLALALYGNFEDNWQRKSSVTFFDLKGAIQSVLHFLRYQGVEWQDGVFNRLGSVEQEILQKWDIPKEVFYAELVLDEKLLSLSATPLVKVKPIPKFPQVRRDIAFVIDEKISVKVLQELMQAAGAPYLQEVTLFDQFIGKNIPSHKRSLAFSLAYQKENGTFTDEEIQSLQSRVGEALKQKYPIEFR